MLNEGCTCSSWNNYKAFVIQLGLSKGKAIASLIEPFRFLSSQNAAKSWRKCTINTCIVVVLVEMVLCIHVVTNPNWQRATREILICEAWCYWIKSIAYNCLSQLVIKRLTVLSLFSASWGCNRCTSVGHNSYYQSTMDPTRQPGSYQGEQCLSFLTLIYIKDGAYLLLLLRNNPYVLHILRYSDFLSVMLTNTGIFLCGLKLPRESISW